MANASSSVVPLKCSSCGAVFGSALVKPKRGGRWPVTLDARTLVVGMGDYVDLLCSPCVAAMTDARQPSAGGPTA